MRSRNRPRRGPTGSLGLAASTLIRWVLQALAATEAEEEEELLHAVARGARGAVSLFARL